MMFWKYLELPHEMSAGANDQYLNYRNQQIIFSVCYVAFNNITGVRTLHPKTLRPRALRPRHYARSGHYAQ